MLAALVCPVGCLDEDASLDEGLRALPPAGSVVNLVSLSADKCIDIPYGDPGDGVNVQIWSCNGLDPQAFALEPAGDGYVLLRNVATDKCLDVYAWSTQNGGNIAQWTCHGGWNQQWQLEEVEPGVATLRSRHSGLLLDVFANQTADGANIIQWQDTGGANQEFAVVPVGSPPPADDPPADDPPDDDGGDVRPADIVGYGANTTGGQGGNVVTVSTGTELHRAMCDRPSEDTPLVIRIDGTLTPGNTTKQSGSCDTQDGVIEIKRVSNLSLIGVGNRGVLDQVGIHVREAENIIIQNLTIRNVRKSNTSTPSNGGDAIGMESGVNNVWVDHNEIYGSTTEGEEHDGLLDFKRDCTNITVSYNHFHDSGRGGLIASNDNGDDGSTNFTFHHNWYENINSRAHLVREAHGHFFNNYYTDIHSTGLNVRNGATLLVEGNYFTRSRNPLGTFFFLGNNPVYEVFDNYFDSSVGWESSSTQQPAGPNVQSTGSVSVSYGYSLDPVQSVPDIVRANAGVGRI